MPPTLLVLSDLHIAPPGPLANFHSAEALAAFLHQRAATPATTLLLAGDVLDFLQVERPSVLDMPGAPALLEKLLAGLAADPQRGGILTGLRAVLDAGGQCVILPGNHDPELHHPRSREVFAQALGARDASGLSMHLDDAPWTSHIGSLEVRVGHGHRVDRWNDIDPAAVRRALATGDSSVKLPPGSRLVLEVLRAFQLAVDPRSGAPRFPFVDLLKPELPAVALLLWYLDPKLARAHLGAGLGLAVQAILRPLGRLLRSGPVLGPAATGESPPATGHGAPAGDEAEALGAELAAALYGELSPDERRAAPAMLRRTSSWLEGHESPAPGTLAAHGGLGRRAVRAFLRGAAQQGAFFDLRAASAEDRAVLAEHLPESARDRVAIFGHTHAARDLRLSGERTYLNTGTWIDLMELPPLGDDSAAQAWIDALEQGRVPRWQRLTYAEVNEEGPALRTWQWPPSPAEIRGASHQPGAQSGASAKPGVESGASHQPGA